MHPGSNEDHNNRLESHRSTFLGNAPQSLYRASRKTGPTSGVRQRKRRWRHSHKLGNILPVLYMGRLGVHGTYQQPRPIGEFPSTEFKLNFPLLFTPVRPPGSAEAPLHPKASELRSADGRGRPSSRKS